MELDGHVGFEEPVELVNRGALWKLALDLEARREAWARGTEVGAPSIKQRWWVGSAKERVEKIGPGEGGCPRTSGQGGKDRAK